MPVIQKLLEKHFFFGTFVLQMICQWCHTKSDKDKQITDKDRQITIIAIIHPIIHIHLEWKMFN